MASNCRSYPGVEPDGMISSETFAEIMHDLCVPLSSVGIAVDLLLTEADSIDPRAATDLLHRVRDGTRWMRDLVSELSGAPSGDPEEQPVQRRVPFNLGRSLQCAVRVALPLFQARRQTIKLNVPARPVVVRGDEHVIRRVTLNLLSNAAKYAPDADEVRVTLRAETRGAVVEIRDHGVNLNAGELERIFEPRVRGASTLHDTRVPGTGRGLSIVKTLVERHGGRVGVQTRPRRGTVFWYTLPRLGAAPRASAETRVA